MYKYINISLINMYLMLKLISDFNAWGRGRASEGGSRDKSVRIGRNGKAFWPLATMAIAIIIMIIENPQRNSRKPPCPIT
jgi:hypothetical protein